MTASAGSGGSGDGRDAVSPDPEGREGREGPGREALVQEARRVGEECLELVDTDPERAIERARRLEEECQASGCALGKAWRLQVEGWNALNRDDSAAGIELFDEATLVCEAEGDAYSLVKALNGLASAWSNRDRFDRSLDIYRRALAVARGLPGHPRLASIIGCNIGATLHELGNVDEAVPYLREALAFGMTTPGNFAAVNLLLGQCLADAGQPEEAESLIRRSIELCVEGGLDIREALARGKLGKFLLRLGRTDEAFSEIERVLVLCRKTGLRSVEAEHLVTRAALLSRRGRPGGARRDLRKAIRLAEETDSPLVLTSALGALAEACAKAGEWKVAYALASRKSKVEDTLFRERIASQTSALRSERAEAETQALRDLYGRLSTISEIGRAISAAIDVDSICRILYERISVLMPAEVFGVAFYDKASDELDYRFFIDSGVEESVGRRPVDAESTLSGWCIRNRKEVVLGDVDGEHSAYTRKRTPMGEHRGGEIRSLIYYPVVVKDEAIAVVTVQSRHYRQYEPVHLEIMKALGAYMGIAFENARLFEELRDLAVTDSLTGCMNRRRFMEVAEREVGLSIRYGRPLSLIMFDLDHFKSVNDNFGHAAGDLALRETADACRKVLRATDFLARWGGEEFVVGLPGTDLAGALALAERLRADFEALSLDVLAKGGHRITASFGVAARRQDSSIEALVFRADAALYRAKDSGRNRVEPEAAP